MPADSDYMQQALALAARGQGYVEPNPMVGCVIVKDGQVVGEGWHQRFGGPHAEIEALRAAGERAKGATLYATLEPCCHHGKTPPCTDAVIAAGVQRVVAAMQDPFPQVTGDGLAQLAAAGIAVEVGSRETEARALNAPYLKLLAASRPWVIAKWAMTLDGKIATAAGHSRWISNSGSRAIVHKIRGRVDAILIGRKTAELDDPLLTAYMAGDDPVPRIAKRIVLDSQAKLADSNQLLRTAHHTSTLIVAGPDAPPACVQRLTRGGCEVLTLATSDRAERLIQLLDELGRRRMTNLLVEGGSEVLGAFLDAGQIDEVHVFIAPKLFGGEKARSPIGGAGIAEVADCLLLDRPEFQRLGDDYYLSGRVKR
jgi:riboflavin biosynthesis protein RibD